MAKWGWALLLVGSVAAIASAVFVMRPNTTSIYITDNVSAANVLRVGVTADWVVDQMPADRPPWSPISLERTPSGVTPTFLIETLTAGSAVNAVLPLSPVSGDAAGSSPFYAWVFFPVPDSMETEPTIAFFDATSDTIIAMQSLPCEAALAALAVTGQTEPPVGAGCPA